MAARVDAVDVARGIALIGMMLVHVGPRAAFGESPPIGDLVAGGRAAPLFAMLAGVSLTLVHRRDPEGAGSARATIVRAVLLIVLGLGLGSIDDMPAFIILAFYGLMIVAALPFRRLGTRALSLVTLAWIAVAPVVLIGIQVLHDPVVAGQAELSQLRQPVDLLMELIVWGAYPAGVWMAYLLVGLLVGRLDLRQAGVGWRLVGVGAALVASTLAVAYVLFTTGAMHDRYGQGWPLLFANRIYPYDEASWNDLLLLGEHTSAPLNVISSTGSALLVIGLCVVLARAPWAKLLLEPLRAAGTMTLTLYTLHVLWFWRASSSHDAPALLVPDSYQHWLLQVVVLCTLALIWQMFFRRGPLEGLMRALSVTVWHRNTGSGARKNAST